MSNLKRITLIILALIGLATSVKLSMIYMDANFNPYALPSFCSINNFIDCDSVAKTTFSQFLGVPLAFWGLCLYLFVLFLCFVDKLQNIKFLGFLKVFKNPRSYIYSIALVSFVISMGLAFISLFKIEKICLLCVFTYLLDLIIALVARSWGEGIIYDIKTSIEDFVEGIKIKKYAISLICIAILGSLFLTYTSLSYVLTPQVKFKKSVDYYANLKTNPYKTSGNLLGEENARIIVQEYIDYNCPACYMQNIMLHRAAAELRGVRIEQHNLPLDKECNKHVMNQVHEHSCMLARYSIAARNQDKFWEMNELLFESTPKSEDEVLKLARTHKFDIPQLYEDANSNETKQKLSDEIEKSVQENIIGTPTIIINMSKYTGLVPYYDLKEKLIQAGAVEK